MEIDAEKEIIELLTAGPSSLRPLRARVPRTTLYEALGRMRTRGTVVPGEQAGTWRLMGGVAAPPSSPPPPITWPTLPGAPHLDVLPSREHRALGRLVLLAATARCHHEHHHVSVALYSARGLKGKTWLGRWAVLALGGGEVVNAVAEGGRSLAARRRSDGQVAAVRAALSSPVLMIDEWRRGDPGVRRLTTLLISGDKFIPFEDDRITVAAVILLAMNSSPDATTAEDSTGLDAAMIRRCLCADLERVELDASFARDGEDRLDRVRAMGPVTLPTITAMDERAVRDRVADALEFVLDSTERMGSLDLVLLGQLAVAACAWGLSVEDAVMLVVHDAATLWSTTGWTAPGWEQALSDVLAGGGSDDVVEEPATPSMVQDLEFDYETRLVEVDRAVRAAGVELEDLAGVLRDGVALRSLGLGADDVAGLRAILGLVDGPRLALLGALDELGLEAGEARAALEGQVAAGKLLALDAEQVEALARELAEVGHPAALATWVAGVVQRHGSLLRMLRSVEAMIVARREQARNVARDLELLAQRVRRFDRVLRRARTRGEGWAIDKADDDLGERVVKRAVRARASQPGRSGRPSRRTATPADQRPSPRTR